MSVISCDDVTFSTDETQYDKTPLLMSLLDVDQKIFKLSKANTEKVIAEIRKDPTQWLDAVFSKTKDSEGFYGFLIGTKTAFSQTKFSQNMSDQTVRMARALIPAIDESINSKNQEIVNDICQETQTAIENKSIELVKIKNQVKKLQNIIQEASLKKTKFETTQEDIKIKIQKLKDGIKKATGPKKKQLESSLKTEQENLKSVEQGIKDTDDLITNTQKSLTEPDGGLQKTFDDKHQELESFKKNNPVSAFEIILRGDI